MEIVIDISNSGSVEALNFDEFPLSFLGRQKIERASEIKFDEQEQTWNIHLRGSETPTLRGFESYGAARSTEVKWLQFQRKMKCPPISLMGYVAAEDAFAEERS